MVNALSRVTVVFLRCLETPANDRSFPACLSYFQHFNSISFCLFYQRRLTQIFMLRTLRALRTSTAHWKLYYEKCFTRIYGAGALVNSDVIDDVCFASLLFTVKN